MEIKAVIFDLNGTILSDEDEYGEAFRRVLKGLGVYTDEKYPHIPGIGLRKNWNRFIKKYKLQTTTDLETLVVKTQEEYGKLLDEVEISDGFLVFVEVLKEEAVAVALATANSWNAVEKIFEKFDIEKYFDIVTTQEEVAQSKPSPEIFNITAEKLMIPAENCVVFEDSSAGVNAAKSAGMYAVGVYRSESHKSKLKKADLLVSDFTQLDYEGLKKELTAN